MIGTRRESRLSPSVLRIAHNFPGRCSELPVELMELKVERRASQSGMRGRAGERSVIRDSRRRGK